MQAILGINASRARSGGAVAHLTGILNEADPGKYGFGEVHVWSYPELLARLQERDWLKTHRTPGIELSIGAQLYWERFKLPDQLENKNVSILLNVDAGSVCNFKPSVTMSRDMLSYEPGEMSRYGVSKARLRLIALRYVQNHGLKTADGAIFLTRYAGETIQRSCGRLHNVAYIPHGVEEDFRIKREVLPWPQPESSPINCLYISNCALYKHQWHVVAAVEQLRRDGLNLYLDLVGGGQPSALKRLSEQLKISDPEGEFVSQHEFVPQVRLPDFLQKADLFVFASSCENMPNTLLQAMAAGLPIACSNRGPMPEVLEDGGVYFDPEDPGSIGRAIAEICSDPALRRRISGRAQELAQAYSWNRCSEETLSFVSRTLNKLSNTSQAKRGSSIA